jgi:hypothetical protein
MKPLLLTSTLFLFSLAMMAQSVINPTSRNGYRPPVRDTLRLLYIFAETLNDPGDTNGAHPNWQPGNLPAPSARQMVWT